MIFKIRVLFAKISNLMNTETLSKLCIYRMTTLQVYLLKYFYFQIVFETHETKLTREHIEVGIVDFDEIWHDCSFQKNIRPVFFIGNG